MASKIMLAPAGNRFNSSSCDLYGPGVIVYGSLYNILVLDLRTRPALLLDEKCIMSAHKAKIVAISVVKDKAENEELLVSASEDSVVKVWDLNSRTCIATTEIKDCYALSWFSSNASIVVAAEQSNILKWGFKQGSSRKIKSGCNQQILLISQNLLNDQLIATGHKYGTVTVINLKTENVLQKLRVHSMDVTSLSWSQISPDVLLSTSMDMSARIWKLGETQPVHTFYQSTSRWKIEDKKQMKLYSTFYPDSENTIVCCARGEVGSITFKEKEKPEYQPFPQKNSDLVNRGLFYFCTWKLDSQDGQKNILCTFDPYKISLFDLENKKCVFTLNLNHSLINKISVSPTNPNLIAICSGDGNIKVWNQSDETSLSNFYTIYVFAKTRILCGAFHPVEENIFAYGTEEGRIGIIDVTKRKCQYNFETHHAHAAYAVGWGPCPKAPASEDKSTKEFFLYSCGGGTIYINKLNEPKSQALNFDEISDSPSDITNCKKDHCDICWKQDYSCLAVGSYKGLVDLYNAELSFLVRLIVPAMPVECLSWHPESTFASPDSSPLKMWLACGGKFLDIHVFDTAEVIEQKEKIMSRPTRKLVGHQKSTLSLSWSIHMDGYLASGSRDGTVQIWNAVQNSCIANYAAHRNVVSSVLWNFQNSDVMMSGGNDSCLRIWKISEQTATSPPSAGKSLIVRKPKPYKPKTKTSVIEDRSVTENSAQSTKEVLTAQLEDKKHCGMENVGTSNEKDPNVQERRSDDVEHQTKRINRKSVYSKKSPPLFPLFVRDPGLEGIEDCKKLVDLYYTETTSCSSSFEELKASLPSTEDDALRFGIFSNQLVAISMLEAQSSHYKKETNLELYEYLQLQLLNVRGVIEEACKNEALSDFLVSLAPMVSHKYWLEVCEKYAIQLIGNDMYNKASLYLLMCGKLYEAINVLAEKGSVYEALALAKVHLPESDDMVVKLLQLCSQKFNTLKFYAFEAQCAIALKEPLRAARTLCLLPDPNGARIATYVCRKFGFEAEAENCAFLCLEKCLSQFDWVTAKKLTTDEENMLPYRMLVHIHEIIYTHIRHMKKENGVLIKEMFCNDSTHTVSFWKGQTCKDSNQSLISYIYTYLKNQNLLNFEQGLKNIHDALNTLLEYRKNSDSVSEAHISVAIHLTQYIVLALCEEFELATNYFLKIFEVSYNVVFLPKVISLLLLPVELQFNKESNSLTWAARNAGDNGCPIVHFYGLYSSLAQKIVDWEMSEEDISVISTDSLLNLTHVVETVRNILSNKTIFDFLAAYFCVSFVTDLQSLISKSKPSFECRALRDREAPQPICANNASGDEDVHAAAQVIKNNTTATVNLTDQGLYKCEELVDNNNIEKLIEMALKEANEKAEQLMSSEKHLKAVEANSISEICKKSDTEPVTHYSESNDELCNTISTLSNVQKVTSDLEHGNSKVENNVESSNISEENLNHFVRDSLNNGNNVNEIIKNSSCENVSSKTVSITKTLNEIDSLTKVEENISCASEAEKLAKKIILNHTCTSSTGGNENSLASATCISNDERLEKTPTHNIVNHINESKKLQNPNFVEETIVSHEQCLEQINIFYNLIKLMRNIVCRDEFALLYYLKDLVRYINLEIASTSITSPHHKGGNTEIQSSIFPENGDKQNECDVRIVPPKQKETATGIFDGSENRDQTNKDVVKTEPRVKYCSSPLDSISDFNDLKNDIQKEKSDKEVKLNEVFDFTSMDDVPSTEISNNNTMKNIESFQTLPTVSNMFQTENGSGTRDSKTDQSEVFKNIKFNENEFQTVCISDFTKSEMKESVVQFDLIGKTPPNTIDQCKEDIKLPSESKLGEKKSEEKPNENINVDLDKVSNLNKNAKFQEKKQIYELISILESQHKEMPYPNPFIAASKIVQVFSELFHKSVCDQVQQKLHEFVHEIVIWVEKFSVNQKPYVFCQICKNVV